MTPLVLYARSRHVPACALAILAGAGLLWAFTHDAGGRAADPRTGAFVLALGAMVVSVGFGGRDHALDRTAAIRWWPRRAAHVLVAAGAVAAAVTAVQALGDSGVPLALTARNALGLTGLAAVGAVLAGAPYAWTLPFGWLVLAFVAPPSMTVTAWMLMPPGTPSSTWTALVLGTAGTVSYALAGPRR
ncbi:MULTISPECIES: hypothetical protein [Streptomyces]|uniref:Uncharacterized protein n=1 Tax=Streptomyces rhizosphaericola TaxID=2564098 RepID=A0ABY2P605_9ACTN|nr:MULTISPECIES: hypothetical protein [Streptomyces]MYU01845.1 hypothetical protein [Streptomyces sp. SID8350]TGY91446.1 hypothetical protein E5Z02_33420 [Streptomyces rhizosphaericola]SCK38951.1 hypothetical protein YUWDRAFT_03194 [Streptomyces sp. AmelKG-D3]